LHCLFCPPSFARGSASLDPPYFSYLFHHSIIPSFPTRFPKPSLAVASLFPLPSIFKTPADTPSPNPPVSSSGPGGQM
jgi:hypothetical protein